MAQINFSPVRGQRLLNFQSLVNVLSIILLLACTACKSDYEKMVAKESAKPGRQDSLFLGITFGMNSKEFYGHCWQLNKEGLVRQGSENMTVMYKLEDFKHKASMNFYPIFVKDTIREMPITVAYDGWAPWNKALGADSLILEVMPLLEKWHGGKFMKMEHPKHGDLFVKQDRNRRISVIKEKDRFVNIVYTDLTVDVKAVKDKVKQDALDKMKQSKKQ